MNDVGSYILEKKDLIAKPLVGAVGNIGAMALTEGSKWAVNKLMNSALQDSQREAPARHPPDPHMPAAANSRADAHAGLADTGLAPPPKLDAKSKQIIEELKRGSRQAGMGIKRFSVQ